MNRIWHYENNYNIEDNQKYIFIYGPYRNGYRGHVINVDYSLNFNNTNNNFNNNQNNDSPVNISSSSLNLGISMDLLKKYVVF